MSGEPDDFLISVFFSAGQVQSMWQQQDTKGSSGEGIFLPRSSRKEELFPLMEGENMR